MSTTIELRKKNTLSVLKVFLQGGEYTKNDLAEKTGLTLATTGKIINKLVLNKVISELGVVESDWGRKASIFELNIKRFYVCGLAISLDSYVIEILDMGRNVIDSVRGVINSEDKFEISFSKIKDDINKLFSNNDITQNNLFGIGITVPGIVDAVKGSILKLPNMATWNGVELKKLMTEEFKTTVIVEKDNYASILYIKSSMKQKVRNAVLLTIRGGIGCGILINGDIYRGEYGLAGEVGHISVKDDGPECNCGVKGCLEAVSSDIAILKNISHQLKNGEKSLLDGKAVSIQTAVECAKKSDKLCLSVFLEASNYLGEVLSSIIKHYDPQYIYIDSIWVRELKEVYKNIQKKINDLDKMPRKNKTKIICCDNNDNILKGAAMLVYEQMINKYDNNIILN